MPILDPFISHILQFLIRKPKPTQSCKSTIWKFCLNEKLIPIDFHVSKLCPVIPLVIDNFFYVLQGCIIPRLGLSTSTALLGGQKVKRRKQEMRADNPQLVEFGKKERSNTTQVMFQFHKIIETFQILYENSSGLLLC